MNTSFYSWTTLHFSNKVVEEEENNCLQFLRFINSIKRPPTHTIHHQSVRPSIHVWSWIYHKCPSIPTLSVCLSFCSTCKVNIFKWHWGLYIFHIWHHMPRMVHTPFAKKCWWWSWHFFLSLSHFCQMM